MTRLLAAGCLCALAACNPAAALLGGLGGGPNVAANVQAGATNAQTIGTTDTSSQGVTRSTVGSVRQSHDTSQVQAERVDRVTVNLTPVWLIIVAFIGWLAPSPAEIARSIAGLFRRK